MIKDSYYFKFCANHVNICLLPITKFQSVCNMHLFIIYIILYAFCFFIIFSFVICIAIYLLVLKVLSCHLFQLRFVDLIQVGQSLSVPKSAVPAWIQTMLLRLSVISCTALCLLIARFKIMGAQLPVFTK